MSDTHDYLDKSKAEAYWSANLKLLGMLLTVWFVVGLGCGVLLTDLLNEISFFGFKLGFWFAQQGSVYGFVIIIFFYAYRMKKIDQEFDVND